MPSPTAAGIAIDSFSAMTSPTVRAAVCAISETLGQLPIRLYRKSEGGAGEIDDTHPVNELINGAANPWRSAQWNREQVVKDALLFGDGFLAIVRDGVGNPRELIRLRQGQVT